MHPIIIIIGLSLITEHTPKWKARKPQVVGTGLAHNTGTTLASHRHNKWHNRRRLCIRANQLFHLVCACFTSTVFTIQHQQVVNYSNLKVTNIITVPAPHPYPSIPPSPPTHPPASPSPLPPSPCTPPCSSLLPSGPSPRPRSDSSLLSSPPYSFIPPHQLSSSHLTSFPSSLHLAAFHGC